MFCNNCGAKIPDNSAFCNVCGKPLNKAKKKKTLGIILITAGLIVVLFGGFITLEATGITEVTGWFDSDEDDSRAKKKDKSKDNEEFDPSEYGCVYPAEDDVSDLSEEDYEELEEYFSEYGLDSLEDLEDIEDLEAILGDYDMEDLAAFFSGFSEGYNGGYSEDYNSGYDISDVAEFFGAFGNGYDYDDYFTPPAPVQEEEHTQSYYDGYGDGYY